MFIGKKVFEITKLIPLKFYNSPEDTGAGGGDVGESAGGESVSETSFSEPEFSQESDSIIPEDWMKEPIKSDPEYAKMKAAKPLENKDAEDDHSSETEEDSSTADEEGDKDTELTDDNSSTGQESEDLAFADNVIEGLKGEDLGKLPDEAQEAIGKFYAKHEEVSKKLTETESRLNRLLEDPVAKMRAELLDSGKQEFPVRGMTQTEKTNLVSKFQSEVGLTQEEAEQIMKVIDKGVDSVARDMAQDYANNHIVQSNNQRKAQETIKKGQEIIMSLSQYNSQLALNEKNISAFYVKGPDGKPVINEQHPEAGKFKEGLGKIVSWCAKLGLSYDRIVDMGPKAIYAAAAASLDMPVALNTEKRDKKILADAKLAALKPFLKAKPGEGKPLSTTKQSGSSERRSAEKTIVDGGYDLNRLASDPEYYESAISKKYGDPEHKAKIDRMVEKGRASQRAVKR
jgi:hypothetical protein